MSYRTIYLLFLITCLFNCWSDDSQKGANGLSEEMAEYKKHCAILVNLANTYDLLPQKKKPKYQQSYDPRTDRMVYVDEEGIIVDPNELTDEVADLPETDPNSPLGKFYALKDIPPRIKSLSRLEKNHLKDMGENCLNLLEVIDQYEFDIIRLKGQWKAFVDNSKTTMDSLRKAFISRLKDYKDLITKTY
jgi:hypothetical protein